MSAPPRAGKDGTSFAVRLALLGFLILTALQVVRHSLLLRVREEARGDEREAFDRYEGQGMQLRRQRWGPREEHTSAEDPVIGQIPTELYLQQDIRVYVLQPDDWVSQQPPESGLYYYVLDGLRDHPRITVVPTVEEADLYLHLVLHTNISSEPRFEDRRSPLYRRIVVIDENDYFDNSFHRLFEDHHVLAFFKRSFVQKKESEPQGINRASGGRDLPYSHWPMQHNYYPFSYGVARRYITGFWAPEEVMAFDDGAGRDLDVVCTLREYHKPAWPKARESVVRWLEEINLPHKVLGEVSDWQEGNRDRTEPRYFDAMRRAKIVVTANPGNWEGDFRLWEAMASKALVFVDQMYMPVPNFFVDGEDLVVFDYSDRAAFERKLRHYLQHPSEARRVAMSGYHKALRHHLYRNRVDYVFATAVQLLDGSYAASGFHMKELAMRAQRHVYEKGGLGLWQREVR